MPIGSVLRRFSNEPKMIVVRCP